MMKALLVLASALLCGSIVVTLAQAEEFELRKAFTPKAAHDL